MLSRFPAAFRLPAFAFWASCPARDFRPPYGRPTAPRSAARTLTGFPCSARAGQLGWAPSIPRGRRCSRDRREIRGRRLPLHGSQPLSPRSHHPPRGVRITRHHQGFTGIRPSSLPLACDPGTAQGQASRTRRRTSGQGQVPNTDPKSRLRHRRTSKPTDSLTNVRPHVATSLSIVRLATTTSRAALRAVARDRLRLTLDPAATHLVLAPTRKAGTEQLIEDIQPTIS